MEMIMSTISLTAGEAAALPAERSARPSLLRRLIEARERQARRIVAYHLATQSDERLLALGLTAGEIQALRRQNRYAEHLVS
jgi:hypothetical protein